LTSPPTSLTVATLFPLVTVAAADEANARALVRRGRERGLAVDVVTVDRPDAFVDADVYLLGGTGRSGVRALVEALGQTGLAARVADGAVLLAVDAGLDAVARTWVDAEGRRHPGLALAPVTVEDAPEVTGTVVTRPDPGLDLPALVGWESHRQRTVLDDGARALFTLEVGAGNRAGDPSEGVLAGNVLGTRLHGPLLALNPELADLVLARAVDRHESWPTIASPAIERARRERIAEARSEASAPSSRGWVDRLGALVRR
jgi:CobQ-like glutamine amidotransferase family enzyme